MIEAREATKQVRRNVFVRSPRRSGLTRVLTSMGATVLAEPGHGLSVTGMDASKIASAAAAHYIPIQELTPRSTLPEDTHLETSQPGDLREMTGFPRAYLGKGASLQR